jgi:soluble lytic murein transglycosylase-like protein
VRLKIVLALTFLAAAPGMRAEYVVLRGGQRLHVTSYERRGQKVELRVDGGVVEVDSTDILAIEPEEIFPTRPHPTAKPPYTELVQAAAQRHGVDPDLVSSVMAMESNFNPRAISRREARGLMQLLPETATRLGVTDIFDPRQNIDAGTRYLRELLDRYNYDLVLTLAAYNAGPDRVAHYRGVPPFVETVSYVHKVSREYRRRKMHARTKSARSAPDLLKHDRNERPARPTPSN